MSLTLYWAALVVAAIAAVAYLATRQPRTTCPRCGHSDDHGDGGFNSPRSNQDWCTHCASCTRERYS